MKKFYNGIPNIIVEKTPNILNTLIEKRLLTFKIIEENKTEYIIKNKVLLMNNEIFALSLNIIDKKLINENKKKNNSIFFSIYIFFKKRINMKPKNRTSKSKFTLKTL